MEKKTYTAPVTKVHQVALKQVIAQSYGPLGMPGGPIDENELEDW